MVAGHHLKICQNTESCMFIRNTCSEKWHSIYTPNVAVWHLFEENVQNLSYAAAEKYFQKCLSF